MKRYLNSRKMKKYAGSIEAGVLIFFALVSVVALFTGRKSSERPSPYRYTPPATVVETPLYSPEPTPASQTYYLGVLPLREPEEMRKRFQPTVDFLRRETGLDIQLKLYEVKEGAASYTDIVRDVCEGRIHFAYLAPVTTVQASANGPVVPFACAQKKGSPIYYGHLAVRMDSPFQDITDLEGKKVCGSSKSSTSGNLMPSAMMKQKGIDKETFFQGGMQFPGSHDKAAQAVIDGEFDGCFINEATFNKFNKDEKVLRSLWRHDAVPEFPFNVNLDAVPQDILNRVKDALFKMHITDLDGVKASNPKYDRWVPIELSDYAGAKAAIDDVYAGKNFYNLDLWGQT